VLNFETSQKPYPQGLLPQTAACEGIDDHVALRIWMIGSTTKHTRNAKHFITKTSNNNSIPPTLWTCAYRYITIALTLFCTFCSHQIIQSKIQTNQNNMFKKIRVPSKLAHLEIDAVGACFQASSRQAYKLQGIVGQLCRHKIRPNCWDSDSPSCQFNNFQSQKNSQ